MVMCPWIGCHFISRYGKERKERQIEINFINVHGSRKVGEQDMGEQQYQQKVLGREHSRDAQKVEDQNKNTNSCGSLTLGQDYKYKQPSRGSEIPKEHKLRTLGRNETSLIKYFCPTLKQRSHRCNHQSLRKDQYMI